MTANGEEASVPVKLEPYQFDVQEIYPTQFPDQVIFRSFSRAKETLVLDAAAAESGRDPVLVAIPNVFSSKGVPCFLSSGPSLLGTNRMIDIPVRVTGGGSPPSIARGPAWLIQDSESGNDFGVGFFLRGGITHQLNENWKLNAFLQAEIAESFRVSNEVSSFKVDPSGYFLGLGTTYTF